MQGKLNRVGDWLFGGSWLRVVPFAVIMGVLYWSTMPGNLTESDDAYTFASSTQECGMWEHNDPRLLLYHFTARCVYWLLRTMGGEVSGLFVLRSLSLACSVGCLVLLGRLLRRVMRLSGCGTMIGLGLFAFSYGFWRFSAEGDVYASALLLVLVVATMIARAETVSSSPIRAATGAGLLAGFTVLFYQPSVIPLFLAMPLLWLRRDRRWRLCGYCAMGGATIVIGYVVAFLISQQEALTVENLLVYVRRRTDEFQISPITLRYLWTAPIKASMTFFHNLLSTNWLFGVGALTSIVQRGFSGHFVAEEIYAASHAGVWIYAAFATLPVLAVATLWMLKISYQARRTVSWNRGVLVMAAWIAAYTAVILRLNPTALESWIMVLPPFASLFALLVVEPCLRVGKVVLPVVTLLVLLFHNWSAGMHVVRGSEGDYGRAKAAWLTENALREDLLILPGEWGPNGTPKIGKHVLYRGKLRVVLLKWVDYHELTLEFVEARCSVNQIVGQGRIVNGSCSAELLRDVRSKGGRIFVFEQFFDITRWGQTAEQDNIRERVESVLAEWSKRSRRVSHHELGDTLELTIDGHD